MSSFFADDQFVDQGEPPGLWGASTEGADYGSTQHEISNIIENQVARLIDQARHDTESKVKVELKSIMESMKVMDQRLDVLLGQLEGADAPAAEAALGAEAVNALLQKVEQQWGQEIRTLKQELHQTILAHNHNADLIKHHGDTIDSLREKCSKLNSGCPRSAEIQQQLQRLDARLKQQQKQRKMEPLFERLSALEQRLAAGQSMDQRAAASYAARGYGAIPSMVPPGVGVGVPPGMMPPGMGSFGKGTKGAAAGARQKTGAQSSHDKVAYRCPTDEEVQARLSKLSQASVTDTADTES